jgi:hypothetical protein
VAQISTAVKDAIVNWHRSKRCQDGPTVSGIIHQAFHLVQVNGKNAHDIGTKHSHSLILLPSFGGRRVHQMSGTLNAVPLPDDIVQGRRIQRGLGFPRKEEVLSILPERRSVFLNGIAVHGPKFFFGISTKFRQGVVWRDVVLEP